MFDLVTALVATLAYTLVALASAGWAARMIRALVEENPPRWEAAGHG